MDKDDIFTWHGWAPLCSRWCGYSLSLAPLLRIQAAPPANLHIWCRLDINYSRSYQQSEKVESIKLI